MSAFTLAASRFMGSGERTGPFGGSHPVIGIIVLVAIIALIIGGIVWAVTTFNRRKHQAAVGPVPETSAAASNASALAILNERLARGEIEPEDYEARKRLLS